MSDKIDMDVVRPSSDKEVAHVIAEAAQKKERLAVAGNNTRCGLGNPVSASRRLELGGLDALVFYEPKDLVVRAQPGMKLEKLRALLRKEGQYLPFEPPSWAALYGCEAENSTIGGAVATALSGPRRLSAGGVRDYILGIEAVNGQGEPYKAGGRTMKNVTGYDVSKFLSGSFGTLSVLTQVTLKVLPAPRSELTLSVPAAQIGDDLNLFVRLANRPLGVTALSRAKDEQGGERALIRLEGSETGVKLHAEDVRDQIAQRDDLKTYEIDESVALWQKVRELAPLNVQKDELVWKSCMSIHQTEKFIHEAQELGCIENFFIDWGGNAVYSTMRSFQPEVDVMHFRDLAKRLGAHVSILRAPDAIREKYGAFPPLDEGVLNVALRTKSALDPLHILNTGRMTIQK